MTRIDHEIKKYKERRLDKPDVSLESVSSRVAQGTYAEGNKEVDDKSKDKCGESCPETIDAGRDIPATPALDAEEPEDDGDDSECSDEQRTFLGEIIFFFVEKADPDLAGKITGMLLELPLDDLT